MATTIGHAPAGVDLWSELEAQLASYEFYAALRRVECAYPSLPRLGQAARAADEAVRLGQVPSLAFAPTMFSESQRRSGDRLWLGGAFFGLFGPNGPLPIHLTEYAHDRRHNFRDSSLTAFADIFHHRLLSLFYRGWADAQPAVQHDRPASDRFQTYVGAALGMAQPTLRNLDAMPDSAKLFHAARFSSVTRTSEGLKQILEDFFSESVAIAEFRGEWMQLATSDRFLLGVAGMSTLLGQGATLGEQVWGGQCRFRVTIGPMSLASFERFLPGSLGIRQLQAVVHNYVGYELAWDLNLVLRSSEMPGVRLGQYGTLGWTTWLGGSSRASDVDDVVLAGSA